MDFEHLARSAFELELRCSEEYVGTYLPIQYEMRKKNRLSNIKLLLSIMLSFFAEISLKRLKLLKFYKNLRRIGGGIAVKVNLD